VPLAQVAALVTMGASLEQLRAEGLVPEDAPGYEQTKHVAVKAAVLPFTRFPGADAVLGPEMRSTGEVMGIDDDFGSAFAKAQEAAGVALPRKGTVFLSVADRDKRSVIFPAKRLADLGFHLAATAGTARVLRFAGVDVEVVAKVGEAGDEPGSAPGGRAPVTVVDKLAAGEIEMVFNTPFGRGSRSDGYLIRSAALACGVPCITTMAGMAAAVQGIEALISGGGTVRPLQDYLGAARSQAPTRG
jgi:carbamoyl-phosphate synthase large subunit